MQMFRVATLRIYSKFIGRKIFLTESFHIYNSLNFKMLHMLLYCIIKTKKSPDFVGTLLMCLCSGICKFFYNYMFIDAKKSSS